MQNGMSGCCIPASQASAGTSASLPSVERLLHEAVNGIEYCTGASERGGVARTDGCKQVGKPCVPGVLTAALYHRKRAHRGTLKLCHRCLPIRHLPGKQISESLAGIERLYPHLQREVPCRSTSAPCDFSGILVLPSEAHLCCPPTYFRQQATGVPFPCWRQ